MTGLPAGVTDAISHSGGSGALTLTATQAGTYNGQIGITLPTTTTARNTPRGTPRTASAAAIATPIGGTRCSAAQRVHPHGQTVCAATSGYSLTVDKTTDGSTVAVPASCIETVPRGRWHLRTHSWPTIDGCAVPHANGDRPAMYFAFRVYDPTAEVTIRLGAAAGSTNPQDTYLALYRATRDHDASEPDAVTVNLNSTLPLGRRHDDVGAARRYLDGHTTDSRLNLNLLQGIWVVAATVPPATTPGSTVTATGQFTINIKIPHPQPSTSD